MVLATDLAVNGVRARSGSLLIFYKEAPRGAAVFGQLSEAGYAVTLCPMDSPAGGPHSLADSDVVLLVAEGECYAFTDMCLSLREHTDCPIVAMAASCDEQLIARTLDAGADEFLPLSIGGRELCARIDAILRRLGGQAQDVRHLPGVTISAAELSVEAFGRRVFLTPIEFRLLSCLASAPGKVFTHETLMSRVWGAEYVDARHYLYLYIRYLREKLEPDPKHPRLIVSEWGVGYRFQLPSAALTS